MLDMPNDREESPGLVYGHRIKAEIDRRGWSLGKLALLAGVDKGYLSQLTRGMVANPGHVTLRKIADGLGVPLADGPE
jgi:transcriptional regulator with XRE-family HTH domain